MNAPRTAIVLGGGLAGIAAAVRLAENGVAVTLLETSRRLGGRATSHDDPATGETLDNCQHVLLGCCTNLLDLYERLGVVGKIDWHPRLHFFDKAGRHGILEADDFPAPLHLTRSLWSLPTLTASEKLAISRGMWAMMRLGRAGRDRLHDRTFEQWLRDHGQPRGAIEKFWAVIVVSALNQWPDRAAADAAIQVFQEGFLAHPRAYVMGTASVPLRRLYDPAVERIERAGGTVRLGASVDAIESDNGRVPGVRLASGERLEADRYVSALPFDRLNRVVPDDLRAADPRLQRLDRFTHSPILGIHLWFDRPVTDHPHMILVDSPLQWVFNKTAAADGARSGTEQGSDQSTGRGEGSEDGTPGTTDSLSASASAGSASDPAGGQYLHGVISAAHDWVAERPDRIVQMAVEELAAYLPAVREAELLRGRAIKEKRATFSIEPGIGACRPTPGDGRNGQPAEDAITQSDGSNLLLAGDWTATGWPATMEGAVRSGYHAAAAALRDSAPLPADDLSPSALYRFLEPAAEP